MNESFNYRAMDRIVVIILRGYVSLHDWWTRLALLPCFLHLLMSARSNSQWLATAGSCLRARLVQLQPSNYFFPLSCGSPQGGPSCDFPRDPASILRVPISSVWVVNQELLQIVWVRGVRPLQQTSEGSFAAVSKPILQINSHFGPVKSTSTNKLIPLLGLTFEATQNRIFQIESN